MAREEEIQNNAKGLIDSYAKKCVKTTKQRLHEAKPNSCINEYRSIHWCFLLVIYKNISTQRENLMTAWESKCRCY